MSTVNIKITIFCEVTPICSMMVSSNTLHPSSEKKRFALYIVTENLSQRLNYLLNNTELQPA